jgi:serine/threonine-protein kinase
MSDLKEGDILAGKYRVERVLGEGGMGVVVAATHVALDERVAVKLMTQRAAEVGDAAGRFLREARAAVKLKSEHVARVRDVGTLESGSPYIVMEYLEGSDLAGVLAAQGTLPLPLAVDYLLQVCDAIAEAHAQGIIHRDLKPGNIFVTRDRDGEPFLKVLDFGISKMSFLGEQTDVVTHSTAILGSPVYMSPEQMKSSRDVTQTTDIWSLGVILYESLGGRVPFDEKTMGALMAKVLTEPPAPLEALRPDLPASFLAVVTRCLDKDPAQRFATVAELARALAPFATQPADARVARIETAGRNATLIPQDRPSRDSSALAVAPTLPLTGSAWSATGASTPRRSRMGLLGIGVAVAVVLGASFRVFGAHRSDPMPTAAAAVLPSSAPPAVSVSTAPPAPVSSAPSALPSAAPTLVARPVPTAHPPPPAKPAVHPTPPTDPFGTSRQ